MVSKILFKTLSNYWLSQGLWAEKKRWRQDCEILKKFQWLCKKKFFWSISIYVMWFVCREKWGNISKNLFQFFFIFSSRKSLKKTSLKMNTFNIHLAMDLNVNPIDNFFAIKTKYQKTHWLHNNQWSCACVLYSVFFCIV
jgi:hypothetical protein